MKYAFWRKRAETQCEATVDILEESRERLRQRSSVARRLIAHAADTPSNHSVAIMGTESRELLRCTASLWALDELVRLVGRKEQRRVDATTPIKITVSTLLLRDLASKLHPQNNDVEWLAFCTGPITPDGSRVLSTIISPPLVMQSRTYVQADGEASHRLIAELSQRHGHDVHVVAHSHLTTGAKGCEPSSVDIKAQKRMEALGCKLIGAIVTQDHHWCFFSVSTPFEVTIAGYGVATLMTSPCRAIFRLATEDV